MRSYPAIALISLTTACLMTAGCKREDTVFTHPVTTASRSDHILGPAPDLIARLDEAKAILPRTAAMPELRDERARTIDLVLEIEQRLLVMEKVRDESGLVKAVAARRRIMAEADAAEAVAAQARRAGDRKASAYWSAYVRGAGSGADRIDFVDNTGHVVRSETTEKGREKQRAAVLAADADGAYSRAAAYDARSESLARAAREATSADVERAKAFLGAQSDLINDRLRPALDASLAKLKAALPPPAADLSSETETR